MARAANRNVIKQGVNAPFVALSGGSSHVSNRDVVSVRTCPSGASNAVTGWVSGAVGAAQGNLEGRARDDYVTAQGSSQRSLQSLVSVLADGKVAQAALLAKQAYETEDVFRKTTGLENARLLSCSSTDTQVYVAWLAGGTAVFAFRGTESARDALADLDARTVEVEWLKRDFPEIRTHAGFMGQFLSVTSEEAPGRHLGLVLKELSGGKTPTRVLCCGHSLGGALSTLGASWAAYQYPEADVRCISLGSPRVGNPQFVTAVRYLVGTTVRILHGWDPVPTVPPPGRSFKHVKGRLWLNQNRGSFKKRPWYCSYGLVTGRVGDHFLGPYTANITSIIGKKIVAEELGLIQVGKEEPTTAVPAQAVPEGEDTNATEGVEGSADPDPDLPPPSTEKMPDSEGALESVPANGDANVDARAVVKQVNSSEEALPDSKRQGLL